MKTITFSVQHRSFKNEVLLEAEHKNPSTHVLKYFIFGALHFQQDLFTLY